MAKLSKIAPRPSGKRRPWLPLVFAVLFGALGAYLLFVSRAATPLESSAVWDGSSGLFVNTNSGLCMSTPGTSQAASGTQVSLASCDSQKSNKNQQWSYFWSSDGSGSTTIRNGYTQCLSSLSSNPAANSAVQVQTCSGVDASQIWSVNPDDGAVRINGLCLAVSDNATAPGSPLVVTDCDGTPAAAGGAAGSSDGSSSDNSPTTDGGSSDQPGSTDSTAITGGSSGLTLSPTATGTANSATSSSAANKPGPDTTVPLSDNSTKDAIGATSIVFALALAGIGVIVWIRGKQQHAWEIQSAAVAPVVPQTPPLMPPPSTLPFTLPSSPIPHASAPVVLDLPPPNLVPPAPAPAPPRLQPPASIPTAPHPQPPKPAEAHKPNKSRKPPEPDEPGEVVVHIRH